VVQISDGAVQTAGVAVKVIPQGGTEASGAGTVAYSADGAVLYTPTQSETDYVAVVFVASKAGCIPATITVVTSASATAGYAGLDWAKITAPTTTVALTGTTISTSQVAASVTARVTANTDQWGGASVTGMPMPTYAQPTGFLAATFPATVSSFAGGAVASVTGAVGSVTNAVTVGTNNDKTGYTLTVTPPTAAAIADAVWDEILTGNTHNIQNSAGKRLRTIASQIVHTGTAQGPGTGSNQIQLDTGASATDGTYDPSMVFIESGTGAGQSRLITQYVGSTRTATVDRDWRVAPAADSVFVIQATIGFNSTNEGLAQGGTATTIILNASANSVDDCYNGQLVFLKSGTGQDQVAIVEDYTGSTRTALIRTRRTNGQWATIPDTTTGYMMVPNLTWTIDEIQSGLATAANQTTTNDRLGYTLAVLAGTISDAQTAAETYAITLGANTFTVDFAGLDSSGNRTGQTLTKV
jgi:hypothetical protein